MRVERLTAFVHGHVQGVGFRWWARSQALGLGLAGYAKNLSDGRVEVMVEGPRNALAELLDLLGEQPSTTGRPGRVDTVVEHFLPARGVRGFQRR